MIDSAGSNVYIGRRDMTMNQTAEAKLNELRTKTDRQLASLISNRLDRGLAFARVLEGEDSRRNWSSMDHFLTHAEEALSEASAWMPLLAGASQLQRRRLEFKRTQLRDMLDRAATPHVRVQTAC
jgi:hypothetical protein